MSAVLDAPPATTPDDSQADPAPTLLGPGGPVRRFSPVAAILLVIVVLAIVTSRTPSSGLPFDPSSTDPDGTKALALILERTGAEVSVLRSTDDLEVDTLLVLIDNLSARSAARIETFVDDGGTAFVADTSGSLTEDLRPVRSQSVGLFQSALPKGHCDVPALEGVDRVRTGATTLFAVPDDAVGCFLRGRAAWLLVRERGSGTLVTAGAPTFLTNSMIGEVDNAGLAAAVLAPRPGTRVGILRPSFAAAEPGDSDESLVGLIPRRLRGAALQLFIAFGVVVLWRMRRLGRPVAEPQAVRLAGSELVLAMGNLFQRTGSRRRAAELLRHDFRRALAERLGLPYDLPTDELADLAAARTDVDRQDILVALGDTVPASDADLVVLAQQLEGMRDALSSSAPAGATRVPAK